MNPILKVLELVSPYHVAHGERSYTALRLRQWLKRAGFQLESSFQINLIPMFYPSWLARILRLIESVIERLPGLRNIACGQALLIAKC